MFIYKGTVRQPDQRSSLPREATLSPRGRLVEYYCTIVQFTAVPQYIYIYTYTRTCVSFTLVDYGYGLLSIHLTPKEISGHTRAAGTDFSLYLLSLY